MIPTSVNGYMPFLSSTTSVSNSKKPTSLQETTSLSRTRSPTSLHVKPPTSSTNNLPKLRSPIQGSNGIDINTRFQSKMFSISPPSSVEASCSPSQLNTITFTPMKLSMACREEILTKDHSWRAFLKALFRSKISKKNTVVSAGNSKPNYNDVYNGATSNKTGVPKSAAISITSPKNTYNQHQCQKKVKVRSKHNNVKAVIPLQRSLSMNSNHPRTLAKLEAILEEESSSSKEDLSGQVLSLALSAPNTINRIRPRSEFMERKAAMAYLKNQGVLVGDPLAVVEAVDVPESLKDWLDSDCSCESLQDFELKSANCTEEVEERRSSLS